MDDLSYEADQLLDYLSVMSQTFKKQSVRDVRISKVVFHQISNTKLITRDIAGKIRLVMLMRIFPFFDLHLNGTD